MTAEAADGTLQPGRDWYGAAEGELEQGDIVVDFDLVVPLAGPEKQYAFGRRNANIVVITQTCDIPKNAQKNLLVAEVHAHKDLVRAGLSHLNSREYKKSLARGTAISDFLLPPTPDGRLDWCVVSFRDIHVVPKEIVKDRATPTKTYRLVSPYREYLSQAFGRFLMRVGLPATLNAFES